jgi:3-dehydro-4-phosphotetronate decarboxylase
MTDMAIRREVVRAGRLMHELRLAHGTSGNLSVRTDEGMLVTPTGTRLGALASRGLARVSATGRVLGSVTPSKEAGLHLGVYRARPQARAIVHLHSPHAAAVSCLAGLDLGSALPVLTAYFGMRIGSIPLVPFAPPGSAELAGLAEAAAVQHRAMLLANHGPVISAGSLSDAVADAEEIEQSARIYLLLRGQQVTTVPVSLQVGT